MIKTTVARRYAQALFELLDQSNIDVTRGVLDSLSQAMRDSHQLRHVVASPAFGVEQKIAVLTALGDTLGCPSISKAFLGLLVKKNRVGFLSEIADAFGKLVDQAKGIQPVTVSSVESLSAAEQDRIKVRLRETLKREVDVMFQTDARHLAGLQISIGSTVVDSTVRGRLRDLQVALTRE